ncbi:MAG: DNA photolyase family protein [Candidatus Eremiobacteraeota bacterium]|nr:DNA photolyase family protein [Candidatus Eremiobacteraeota bacterium]
MELQAELAAPHGVKRWMRFGTSIVWFRRDLRLADHVALERAQRDSDRVVCAFVLDPDLLRSERVGAPIVSFFFDALTELRATLRSRGSDLALLEGRFLEELSALARRVDASAVYFNADYDPHAVARDEAVTTGLRAAGLDVTSFIDHVYYGAHEIRKDDGEPYKVYTPYRRRWQQQHEADPRLPVDSLSTLGAKLAPRNVVGETRDMPLPEEYGHASSAHYPKGGEGRAKRMLEAFVAAPIADYAETRNFPALAGTSHLSPHLRAGTIGIRTCVHAALGAPRDLKRRTFGLETWVGELIWRDFYQQILANYPRVSAEPFLAEARNLQYRDSADDFLAWCEGRTGYPIVDAAMTQLNTFGWMHNRLRMVVASFLTKDLLLDYSLGERYFERHLADADMAANNGGWQWTASTGTDAAPYFRVFNPILQSKRFDPDGSFIRTMLPALANVRGAAIHAPWTLTPMEAELAGFELGRDYPHRIVDHSEARARALAFFSTAGLLKRSFKSDA